MTKEKLCDKKMSFDECELAILRMAVDKAEEKVGKNVVNSPEIKKIISILEIFLRKKSLICYGGTALNNIMPKQDQFYNKDIEIPDYDFFSTNALNDAKELCDNYLKEGFIEVEGKPGMHHGTFKVFVNFIPIADITFLHKDIFKEIKKEAIKVDGILYAPPNFLRMSMFLELSRPEGDTSRFEKVLKRLNLLNKNYPLKSEHCEQAEFQRDMVGDLKNKDDVIFDNVRSSLINQGVIFFGGYAISLYSKYMPNTFKKKLKKYPDFDVLSEEPLKVAENVKERLQDIGIKNVKIIKRNAIGEIIAAHYEIKIKNNTIAFIYEPIACHSYNEIKIQGDVIKIATIDTILSFYLAFLYASREYYDNNRILCMAQYLFTVQQENRLKQKGLLKRFSIHCYGHQQTIEELRAEKAKKFAELKDKKGTPEYDEYFLRYRPGDKKIKNDVTDVNNKNLNSEINKRKRNTKKYKNNNNNNNKYKKTFRKNNYLQELLKKRKTKKKHMFF